MMFYFSEVWTSLGFTQKNANLAFYEVRKFIVNSGFQLTESSGGL